jgi:hypothetical protein
MNYDMSNFIPFYPSINSSNFNRSIYRKAEFRIPAVPLIEDFPSNPGDLMTHQTIISRMMSSYTPYDGVLLMHEMGTGKTCSAIAILELIRSEDNEFNRYIYVCSSDAMRSNFKTEFKGVCTKGDYEDVSLSSLGILTMTYNTFLKKFKGNNNLKNSVVIIDEVHNIRRSSSYFGAILKSAVNVKTILLSGTPMTDSPSGISSVMNIILPDDKQLPTNQVFFDDIDEDGINLLRSAFKGRISYIKSTPTAGIKRTFITNQKYDLPGFKHYKLYASEMSLHQHVAYSKALESDSNDGSSPAYSNSLQASSFVGDNGEYQHEDLKNFKINFKSTTVEGRLTELEKYSVKYADSIRMILDAKSKGKNIFIFNKYIRGGGLHMFAKLLVIFGFYSVTSSNVKKINPGQNRFILLTGDPKIDKKALIERFNRDDNKNGNIIQVVLASDAISEGYTFKNIQIIDIHSPWFQFAKISQAIARGIRFGSHRVLLMEQKEVDVNIYLRVSIPPKEAPIIPVEVLALGIDVYAYKTAEDKDIIVKKIEHIIKEEAIDSRISLKRNQRVDMDFSRDCDYMECEYSPFPLEDNPTNDTLDYSTYQMYYGTQDDTIEKIIELFGNETTISFVDIVNSTVGNALPVLAALYHIITTDVIIEHKTRGYFLREQNDTYYLVDTISNRSSLLDVYYVENIQVEYVSNIVVEKFDVLDTLDDKNITNQVNLVNVFIKEGVNAIDKGVLLEHVILSNIIPGKMTTQTEQVKTLYEGMFGQINGVYYSWYPLHVKSGPCRKIYNGAWVDCTDEEETEIIVPYLEDIIETVVTTADNIKPIDSPSNVIYYGLLVNSDTSVKKGTNEEFKIMTTEKGVVKLDDNRMNNRGQNCQTFIKGDLFEGDIKLKLGITNQDIENITFGAKLTKPRMCAVIKSVMKDKNLLIKSVNVER